jgi:hypothetical protein
LPRPIVFQDKQPLLQTPVIRVRKQEAKQSPIILPKSIASQESTRSETPPPVDRPSRSAERSSRRPRLVASLERGSQRVFELLTPRRLRKDPSQAKICKVNRFILSYIKYLILELRKRFSLQLNFACRNS